MPRLSVIMNCLNSAKYLREAIESVYAQTFTDWEIIFWDNDSTDNSAEIAKSYDWRMRYFKSDTTYPLGMARNLAIEKAKGEYIAFLDCDDAWLSDKLERQISLLDSNPVCGFVYSDAYRVDERGKAFTKFSDDITFPRGRVFYELLYDCPISAFSSVVVRKKALDKTGFFNPKYNICEDYDLFLRIAESFEVDFCPQALLRYRHHEGNITRKTEASINEQFDIIKYWLKRRPEIEKDHNQLVKKANFHLFAKLGVFYVKKGKLLNAIKCFNNAMKSFRYNPILIAKSSYRHLYLRRVKRVLKRVRCLLER